MEPNYTRPLTTFTGKQFYPHLPDSPMNEICIRDIAHALSLICRYGGHCKRFYSVAEHSVHLARFLLKDANRSWRERSQPRHTILEWAMWALLHDASEAYAGDIVRPAKVGLPDYARMESRIITARRYNTAPHGPGSSTYQNSTPKTRRWASTTPASIATRHMPGTVRALAEKAGSR